MEGKSTEQQRVFHVRRHWRGRPSEIPATWGHQGWLALPGQLAQWCPRQPEPDTPPLAPSTGPSTALRSGRLWSTRTAPRHTQINQHRTCKCRCVHGRDCTCSMHSPTHTHQTGHPRALTHAHVHKPTFTGPHPTPSPPTHLPTHTLTHAHPNVRTSRHMERQDNNGQRLPWVHAAGSKDKGREVSAGPNVHETGQGGPGR